MRYALASKVCQLAALPITLFLISTRFTPETQGFYYTFFSLIALQSFLELGLHTVIVNIVSHDAAHVTLGNDGRLTGEPAARARILGLAGFVLRWYAGGSLIFLIAVGSIGVVFFRTSTASYQPWLAPWLALVVTGALQFAISPFNYLLEGLGEVSAIARMRWLTVLTNIACTWFFIASSANLWAPVATSAAVVAMNAWFLFASFPEFFKEVPQASLGEFDWKREVWPLQWRIAIQGLVNYFFYSLFNPILFHYHGPTEAGRFGMTLQIFVGIQSISMAWLQAVVPQFGRLVSARQYDKLEAVWWSASSRVIAMSFVGNLVFVVFLAAGAPGVPEFAQRVTNPAAAAALGFAHWLLVLVLCMAAYMRSYKREPMTWVSFVSGAVAGGLVWILGTKFGALGAAAAMLIVTAFILLPATILIWRAARQHWPMDREKTFARGT